MTLKKGTYVKTYYHFWNIDFIDIRIEHSTYTFLFLVIIWNFKFFSRFSFMNEIILLNDYFDLYVMEMITDIISFFWSVGDAIGAFAAQMLKGSVPPGVYFPEEVPGRTFREEILADISVDAITYSINIDSEENSIENESFTFKL